MMPAIVYEFARNNDREVVRATLQEYQGREVADLRVWLPRSSDGVLVPGSKGLSVDRRLLPELEAAVRALREADRP
jgi:hypothetical protein